eukprot:2794686-Rhodomonas_salina.1
MAPSGSLFTSTSACAIACPSHTFQLSASFLARCVSESRIPCRTRAPDTQATLYHTHSVEPARWRGQRAAS